jgi:3-oxoadipate enol-lactonase
MAYVRTRVGRLFYEERGERKRAGDPAIVLLHGLLFDGGMWRGQVEPLSAFGRVLVFDGPGHGKSEPPPRFMLEEHADAIFDAFGDLKVDRAVLVGLSWGGMLAMRFALQHPGNVAGLALLDTSANEEPLGQKIKNRAFIAMHRRIGFPYGMFLKEVAPKMFSDRTLNERPELVQAAYRRAMGFDRKGAARAALAVVVKRTNILDKIPRISAPTLVMCGTEDRATAPRESEAIAKNIPGARLVMLEGLGHMSPVEDSDAVNAHLVPFVRDLVTSRS